ncbi:MAG: MBL fold metallo-hydrolase [Armatimonadetes bacterium]|nr:MBL fold metallo-hydrolase [Armatimonadota bacterium]
MQITFWDGIGCIGGNKMLLERSDGRFLLDFGTNIGRSNQFYDAFLQSRESATGVFEPIRMGLLPNVQGLYRDDFLWGGAPDGPAVETPDALLLSHAHADHVGAVSYLRHEVKVYCTLMSAAMIRALEETSTFSQGVCVMRMKETNEEGLIKGVRGKVSEPKTERRWRPYFSADRAPSNELASIWVSRVTAEEKYNEPLDLSHDLPDGVKHWPVDHSIYGACAFGVETEAGWVVYTGDLRFHGSNRTLSEAFRREAAALGPRALIIEGTTLSPGKSAKSTDTELEVRDRAADLMRTAEGLVVADFSQRHLERLCLMWEAARASNRTLVIPADDAYLLYMASLAASEHEKLPQFDEIAIFVPYSTGHDKTWRKKLDDFLPDVRRLAPPEVRANAGELVLCIGYFNLNQLPYVAPKQGGLWIRSSSEPFNEEMELDIKRLKTWLDEFGFRYAPDEEEDPLHVSGHASPEDLFETVRAIRPQTLIPIHSEHPELYEPLCQELGIELWIPQQPGDQFGV